ncbi:Adenylate kinase [Candidatus Phytoplasma rubi]|uniref:Adenylate kinase n=1 Tax=Candidatus Phytoplasma rubi TaxID=399025 RepID=A0ABY7BTN4_9MOLU|nr:adenylate kinase [Candidatus Phytoplasma rubi]WAN63658.1 Adenylate kinase [Candidatus Phytoplasma rubi]
MNIILIGPPASGKGTQSLILSKNLNIPHISIGDIFRENLRNKTDLGKIIKSYINKGLLVNDKITNSMISKYLTNENIKKGFILDGYPRNLDQARFLTEELDKKKIVLNKVFYFNVSEKLLKKRIIGRIVCPQCGEIYHKENKSPEKYGFCDNDNTYLIQRKDDNLNTFQKRLLIYKKETFPLIEYYKKNNKLTEIKVDEDTKSIKDITEIILKEI